MGSFTGKIFLRGVQHLDGAAQRTYARHGTTRDGRWAFVERIIEEAMVRMAEHEEGTDGE